MIQVHKTLLGILLIVTASACSVDDGGTPCAADFTEALEDRETTLVGNWTLTALSSEPAVDLTQDGNENPSEDVFAQYSDCLRDVEYRFGPGRAFSFREGQNFTDCSNQLIVEGTWEYTGLAINLNSSCAVQSIPVRFNDDFSEFFYSGVVTYNDVEGNMVETITTFVFSEN